MGFARGADDAPGQCVGKGLEDLRSGVVKPPTRGDHYPKLEAFNGFNQ
jgi:hypothetical protein